MTPDSENATAGMTTQELSHGLESRLIDQYNQQGWLLLENVIARTDLDDAAARLATLSVSAAIATAIPAGLISPRFQIWRRMTKPFAGSRRRLAWSPRWKRCCRNRH